jgi:hypothetical protein
MSNQIRDGKRLIRALGLVVSSALLGASAQTLTAQQPASPAQPTKPADDLAARAAARRAKFDAERRRLEQTETKPSNVHVTLFISPAKVGMLVGESHSFSVFDVEGNDLTSSAQWSSSDSSVASFDFRGEPAIASQSPGTVTIYASVGDRDAEAIVTVYPGNKMPSGAVQWSLPVIPGYREIEIVRATSTTNGPDMYATDENDQGEHLLRALLSDGRQIWMRKFSAKSVPVKPTTPEGASPRVPAPAAQPHQ